MGRANYFNLAREIFKLNPNIDGFDFFRAFELVIGPKKIPTLKTLDVWKTTLRKEGLNIPYRKEQR